MLRYTGWTADDCKRLVLHPHFQGVIAHIKDQRLKFRNLYPNKPNVLRCPFNNCVGLDSTFDFDISTFNPRWQSADEEGDEERRAERAALRETRAARKAGTAIPPPVVVPVEALQMLVDMGFDREQARHALEMTNGSVEAAAGLLI
jgi:hypothetical protein